MAELRVQPAPLDWYIYQGDTVSMRFKVLQGTVPVDITGWVLNGSIRTTPDDPDAPVALTITKDAADTSVFYASLSPADSRLLARTSVYDIQRTTGTAGDVRTLLRGTIFSEAEVTR